MFRYFLFSVFCFCAILIVLLRNFIMARQRKNKVQACGLCGRNGHNKRRCPKVKSTSVSSRVSSLESSSNKNIKIEQTCSVCGRTGHNKRTCLEKVSNVKQKDKHKEFRVNNSKSKKQKTSTPIFVSVKTNVTPSSYIVNLKKEDNASQIWKDVPVFQEKQIVTPQLEVVNFAKMVRDANAKKQMMEPVKKVIPKLSVTSVRIPSDRKSFKKWMYIPKIHLSRVSFAFLLTPFFYIAEMVHKLFIGWLSMCTSVARCVYDVRFSLVQSRQNFSHKFTLQRIAVFTFVLFVIIGLPFPALGYYYKVRNDSARVATASTNGFIALQSSTVAALNSNIPKAEQDLNKALYSFGTATNIVGKENGAVLYVAGLLPVIGKEVSGRYHLLSAGQHLALGNTYLFKAIDSAQADPQAPLTDTMASVETHITYALPQYQAALHDLATVDPSVIPINYRQSFNKFRVLYTGFVDDLKTTKSLIDTMRLVFGSNGYHRYLIVFQNENELRPTGGFIGSFAVVDVQKGKILNIDVPAGGSYDLQGQLNQYLVPPLPLQLVNGRWEFQDANWFPDFQASATELSWFYQHSRNSTVDGVIAINASVLQRLLKVTGPIQNKQYGVTVNANNVLDILQTAVTTDPSAPTTTPKAVIGALMQQVLSKIQHINKGEMIALLTQLQQALGQKEIQAYFSDPNLESKVVSYGWGGTIVQTRPRQDFLEVVDANLNSEKSDTVMTQDIQHNAIVQSDGSIIDTVTITRTHHGAQGQQFVGIPNVEYIRVYVPQGAILLKASGFTYPPESAFHVPESWYKNDPDLATIEQNPHIDQQAGTRISNQFGKTTFGNWMVVNPGETQTISFTYRLPFSIFSFNTKPKTSVQNWMKWFVSEPSQVSQYSIVLEKQSGINSEISSRVRFDSNWIPVWTTSDTHQTEHGAIYHSILDTTTHIVGVVMKRIDTHK